MSSSTATAGRRRTAAALVITAVLGASLLPTVALGPAAAAGNPAPLAEYVIPARTTTDLAVRAQLATQSGYLVQGATSEAFVWRAYGSTKATEFSVLPGQYPFEAGPDTIAVTQWDLDGDYVTFRDMRDGSTETVTLPESQSLKAVVGNALLTMGFSGSPGWHWLTLENGSLVDRPIAGVSTSAYVNTSSAAGALLITSGDGKERTWLAPGRDPRPAPAGVRVEGDWLVRELVGWSTGTTTIEAKVWDTKGALAESDGKPLTWAVSDPDGELLFVGGVVANELIVHESGGLFAHPLNGGPARKLLSRSGSWMFPVVGDRLVVDGGNTALKQAIYAVQPGQDGKSVAVQEWEVPPLKVSLSNMSMENGRLHTVDYTPGKQSWLLEYVMPAAGAPKAGSWRRHPKGGLDSSLAAHRVVATGEGGVVMATNQSIDHFTAAGKRSTGSASSNPYSLQASGRFAAYVRGSGPQPRPVEVVDLDQLKDVRSVPVRDGVFSLSGYRLWREKSNGTVEAVDVRSGAVVATHTVANCDIKALEAWGGSVYWKCDAKAGVYDTSSKTKVALPEHNDARLGNGFVAWEKDGVLHSTDLRGTTGTRAIGKPVHAEAGSGWTVDKQSGRIAYADADYAVHVVDAGVPNGDLVAIDRATATAFDAAGGTKSWSAAWFLNRTASSWTLTVRAKAGGAVVRTISGGEARGAVRTGWDGKDALGHLVANGGYEWTLTGKPADGTGPELKSTGTVQLTGGSAAHRDLTGKDGFGDLATLDSTGVLAFHGGDGKGGLTRAKVTGAGWPTTSTVVPFGDMNGDRCNDVLVRNSAGTLRLYRPACGSGVSASLSPKSLGTGFNAYDVLTSAGDLTGDGRADLLARETTTGYLYLFAQDAGSVFKPRVRLPGGWKAYKHVVGAGDLNGDGRGDLLTVDAANALWRLDGTGNGTFKARVQVKEAGWASGRVQFIGVGDISGDGKADVVSRNTTGELLRNSGDGKGGLLATTKIATGFGGYKGLF
ncbi:FG-GAP-like repeat-containing protein [Streptomyces sp. NPDC099050]|uniref:FG-GAP-like repeat-containing protein n=1 Tax=Streptomyces sp. NPDC099050 TaxID=3366100 RepID=UPI003830D904